MNKSDSSPSESVQRIRLQAHLSSGEGPTDEKIEAAINAFAEQLHFWFTRVIEEAVPKYRKIIVGRINALIRPIEFDGVAASVVASRLVADYVNRNFVTAGGWAIEKMAISIGKDNTKAIARGIDLHRVDQDGNHHLYVIKSGTVTRNSDILKQLKVHARDAERLIRQGGAKVGVFANYAVATGATKSTFEDGIYRPSSGTFWSEVTDLPETKALALVSEVAKAGGLRTTHNTDVHIGALVTLVKSYIAVPSGTDVDWPFLFNVTMSEKSLWKSEDVRRHEQALDALKATGYRLETAAQQSTSVVPKILRDSGAITRKGSK